MHVPQTEVILRHEGAELARVTLPPGDYVIGRNADVEIFADTPLISRRHAQLTINYDHLLIEDLGSSNGTFVNEQRIAECTRLYPNQVVQLGDITVELRRERAPSEPGVSLARRRRRSGAFCPVSCWRKSATQPAVRSCAAGSARSSMRGRRRSIAPWP